MLILGNNGHIQFNTKVALNFSFKVEVSNTQQLAAFDTNRLTKKGERICWDNMIILSFHDGESITENNEFENFQIGVW